MQNPSVSTSLKFSYLLYFTSLICCNQLFYCFQIVLNFKSFKILVSLNSERSLVEGRQFVILFPVFDIQY